MSGARDDDGPYLNGDGDGLGVFPRATRSIGSHAGQIRRDAGTLADEFQATADDVALYLTDSVQRRPYSTLGAAAAIGYVFGGGLRSPLTVMLLSVAARVLAAQVVRELGDIALQMNVRSPQSARSRGGRHV